MSAPPHLIVPAKYTEAACGRLGGVEAGGASRVVVVDLGRLGDTAKELLIRRRRIQGQILARDLKNTKT